MSEARFELPESRYVDVDGKLHYREWEGPDETTFVCVHGLGGSHLNWMAVAPGLAKRGRVLALDLPGFGKSPREGRPATLQGNRRIVSGFIREMSGSRPVVLVGNSMGGGLALFQAAFAPETVSALVLTSPVLPWSRGRLPAPIVLSGFALYQVPKIAERLVRNRVTRLGAERLVQEGFRLCTPHPERIPHEVIRAHVELAQERNSDEEAIPAFLEAARSLVRTGSRTRWLRTVLDRVRQPVLVIQGREDRLVPYQYAVRAASGREGWRLKLLDGVGHVAMLEVPDRWVGTVEQWLDDPAVGGNVELAS